MTTQTSKNTAPKQACVFNDAAAVQFVATGEKNENTFSILCYDGGINKHWYWGNFAIDLAGLKFQRSKLPILDSHNTQSRVGFTTRQTINGEVTAEGKFLSNPSAQQLRQDMLDGFPMQASLSGMPSVIEWVEDGSSVEVNGKILKGPGAVWRQAIIDEISMCTLGALSNTESKAFADGGKGEISFNVLEKETEMSEQTVKLTAAQFATQNPELLAEITANARQEGLAEGKTAGEKTGFTAGQKDVMDRATEFAKAFAGDEAFAFEQFAKGATLEESKTAYIAKLKAAPKTDKKQPTKGELEFAASDDQKPPAASQADGKKTDEQLKSEFAASSELQNEFSSVESYIAYSKAAAAGRVKAKVK
jgi:hypothetical protein